MLQQVTITTPGITRCMLTDSLESRETLAEVMRLQPSPRKFEWGLLVAQLGISKGKLRK